MPLKACVLPLCIPYFAFPDVQTSHWSMLATQHLPRQLPGATTAGMLMAASRTQIPALRSCSASQLGQSWADQKAFCTTHRLAGGEPSFPGCNCQDCQCSSDRLRLSLSAGKHLAGCLCPAGRPVTTLHFTEWAGGSLVPVSRQGLDLLQWPFATAPVTLSCSMLLQDAAADAAQSGQVGPVSLVASAMAPTAASHQ